MLRPEQYEAIVRATGRLPPGHENFCRPLQWSVMAPPATNPQGPPRKRGRPKKEPQAQQQAAPAQPAAPVPPPLRAASAITKAKATKEYGCSFTW
mmetsp:Transcript_37930/g.76083  ORF Transcript_37930/g.76083 Transcript_37930/m.76083 type:complete len:95 (+) Transcript_37930:399-683(+)